MNEKPPSQFVFSRPGGVRSAQSNVVSHRPDGGLRGWLTPHRCVALLVLLCTFVAFILSVLVVNAGNHGGFLSHAEMIQLNISRFGETPFFNFQTNETESNDSSNNTDDSSDSNSDDGDDDGNIITDCISEIFHHDSSDCVSQIKNETDSIKNATEGILSDIEDDIKNIKNDLEKTISDWLSAFADSLKSALDLPDFYNVYLLNHCPGEYTPLNYTWQDATAGKVRESIGNCSSLRNGSSHHLPFNLTGKVDSVLPDGISLENLHWPSAVTDAEAILRLIAHPAFILYCIGAVATGLAFAVDLLGMFTLSRWIRLPALGLEIIAFFSLMIVSAGVTLIIKFIVHGVNKIGADIGVAAKEGSLFLGMTWAAVGLLGVSILISFGLLFIRPKKDLRGEKSFLH